MIDPNKLQADIQQLETALKIPPSGNQEPTERIKQIVAKAQTQEDLNPKSLSLIGRVIQLDKARIEQAYKERLNTAWEKKELLTVFMLVIMFVGKHLFTDLYGRTKSFSQQLNKTIVENKEEGEQSPSLDTVSSTQNTEQKTEEERILKLKQSIMESIGKVLPFLSNKKEEDVFKDLMNRPTTIDPFLKAGEFSEKAKKILLDILDEGLSDKEKEKQIDDLLPQLLGKLYNETDITLEVNTLLIKAQTVVSAILNNRNIAPEQREQESKKLLREFLEKLQKEPDFLSKATALSTLTEEGSLEQAVALVSENTGVKEAIKALKEADSLVKVVMLVPKSYRREWESKIAPLKEENPCVKAVALFPKTDHGGMEGRISALKSLTGGRVNS